MHGKEECEERSKHSRKRVTEQPLTNHSITRILHLQHSKDELTCWASCHFRFWSVVGHALPCYSMKMEVPGLADSLQQCLCVNSGIYVGNVLDTDPGRQQSKLLWALSAEVGSASRMHCTGLWHVKAAQQPFFHSQQRRNSSRGCQSRCVVECGCETGGWFHGNCGVQHKCKPISKFDST